MRQPTIRPNPLPAGRLATAPRRTAAVRNVPAHRMLAALLLALAALSSPAPAAAQAQNSLLPLLALDESSRRTFEEMLASNPGLDSALVAMRSQRLCRGVRFERGEIDNALALLAGALSPSFRDNPDVSRGRLEREQIDALSEKEPALDAYRRANLNCFELEGRVEQVRAELVAYGQPLSARLAKVMQQGPGSSEITLQEPPVININIQEPPRRKLLEILLPWNW